MKKQTGGKFKRGRRPSAAAVAAGEGALRRYNAISATLPRCGARNRTTGEPCQHTAMANGRCYRHGGKTPSGDNWHRVQWPNPDAPDVEQKLARKLLDHEKAAKRRAKRLAAMTADERMRHEAWQRSHRPGSASARAAARNERRQTIYLTSGSIGEEKPIDVELKKIQRKIDELEALLAKTAESIFD